MNKNFTKRMKQMLLAALIGFSALSLNAQSYAYTCSPTAGSWSTSTTVNAVTYSLTGVDKGGSVSYTGGNTVMWITGSDGSFGFTCKKADGSSFQKSGVFVVKNTASGVLYTKTISLGVSTVPIAPSAISLSTGTTTFEGYVVVNMGTYNAYYSCGKVSITKGCPTVTASLSADVKTGVAPLTVNFSASISGASSYGYNFGDGQSSVGASSTAHTYASAGTYSVKFVAVNACSNSATSTQTITVVDEAVSVSSTILSTASPATTQSVALTTNVPVSISSSSSWLTPSNSSLAPGVYNLNLFVEENTGSASRSASVTIQGYNTNKVITITQAGIVPTLVLSSATVNVGATTTSASVAVSSNVAWQAYSNQSWITPVTASGNGNATLNFSLSANNTFAQRTAIVTVKSNTITQTLTLIQSGNQLTLTPSLVSPSSGTVNTTKYSFNCSYTGGLTGSTPTAVVVFSAPDQNIYRKTMTLTGSTFMLETTLIQAGTYTYFYEVSQGGTTQTTAPQVLSVNRACVSAAVDYPFTQGAPGDADKYGFYINYCTSGVAYVLNQNGINFYNSMFGTLGSSTEYPKDAGEKLGNAFRWSQLALLNGIVVDQVPDVLSIAYWAPYTNGASSVGHVGVVICINNGSKVTILDCNGFGAGPYRIGSFEVDLNLPYSSTNHRPTSFIHIEQLPSGYGSATAVKNINNRPDAPKVSGGYKTIIIEGGGQFAIYALDGRLISNSNTQQDQCQIPIDKAGIYIALVDGISHKVIVK